MKESLDYQEQELFSEKVIIYFQVHLTHYGSGYNTPY